MIIKQLTLPFQIDQSFQIRRDYFPKHQLVWHCHKEWELVYINKGTGTLFIGDRIKPFQPGDSILIASQTPHYWLFEELSQQTELEQPIDCIVAHFNKNFGLVNFLGIPELCNLKYLLENSEQGRFIRSNQNNSIKDQLEMVLTYTGLQRLLHFLTLLDKLESIECETLTSKNYSILNQSVDQYRMNGLMEYIGENYKQKIKLSKLASIADLTENSFCRYFKQKTSKTPIQFITELRISYACSQLRNSQLSLKEICFDSGFYNFASFHKSFKGITGTTPKLYKNTKKQQ